MNRYSIKRATRKAGARPGAVPSEGLLVAMAELFKILGDPTRVSLLHMISRGERSVTEIGEALKITSSAVSHQLRLLRSMHLVKRRKAGQHAMYSLDDEHVMVLFEKCAQHVAHGARRARILTRPG